MYKRANEQANANVSSKKYLQNYYLVGYLVFLEYVFEVSLEYFLKVSCTTLDRIQWYVAVSLCPFSRHPVFVAWRLNREVGRCFLAWAAWRVV